MSKLSHRSPTPRGDRRGTAVLRQLRGTATYSVLSPHFHVAMGRSRVSRGILASYVTTIPGLHHSTIPGSRPRSSAIPARIESSPADSTKDGGNTYIYIYIYTAYTVYTAAPRPPARRPAAARPPPGRRRPAAGRRPAGRLARPGPAAGGGGPYIDPHIHPIP